MPSRLTSDEVDEVATLLLVNEEPFTNGKGCCWSKGPLLTAAATAATAVAEGFRRVLETLLPP